MVTLQCAFAYVGLNWTSVKRMCHILLECNFSLICMQSTEIVLPLTESHIIHKNMTDLQCVFAVGSNRISAKWKHHTHHKKKTLYD